MRINKEHLFNYCKNSIIYYKWKLKKLKTFDKNIGLCKSFENHDLKYHDKDINELANKIANIICTDHFTYHQWSTHIFHREATEKIIGLIGNNKELIKKIIKKL